MNGQVDDRLRALVKIELINVPSGESHVVTAWIDTAFNGQLVFPRPLIKRLGLEQHAVTEAILADGSKVTLESYACSMKWFGKVAAIQVVANDGKMPLLGTELLEERVLFIDYKNRRLSLD